MPRVIVGIGADCEEISRFGKMGRNAMEKIFTKNEISYCSGKASPSQHFAARFAGKEAIIKCFSSDGKKIAFNRIEIVRNESGAPVVRILDSGLKDYDVMLSLSHSGNMAMAFAIVLKKER
jgi:holo-[acyl-carrier protein] synthase